MRFNFRLTDSTQFLVLCSILSVLTFGLYLYPTSAQVPTRLFDVRNGNGLVDNGTTYTRATYIAFKDNASKDAIIDAVCAMGGYQATVPNPAYDPNDGSRITFDAALVEGSQPTIANPQTKQAFFNKRIEQFLRDNYRAWKTSAAEKAAKATAEAAADAELPPNQ